MVEIRELIGGFSGFKGRLLLTAGIVVLCGMAWDGARQYLQSERGSGAGNPSPVMREADWTYGATRSEQLLEKADRWSEGLTGLGFMFMIAVLAGSFLRAAFKTGLTLLFVSVIVIWFLENRGYAQVWGPYYETVEEGGTWLTMRVGVMGHFLMDHLASAGVALCGFGFGLRK